MKTAAYLAFALWLAFVGTLQALGVGDKLPDDKGLTLGYAEGKSVCLRMEDHHLQLFFIDGKGLLETCSFKRVIIRVDRTNANDDDLILSMHGADNPLWLENKRFIKPPYVFRVTIIMYPNENDDEGRILIPTTMFHWTDDATAQPAPDGAESGQEAPQAQ
jgi:hypothetical protein